MPIHRSSGRLSRKPSMESLARKSLFLMMALFLTHCDFQISGAQTRKKEKAQEPPVNLPTKINPRPKSAPAIPPTPRKGRETIALENNWRFLTDATRIGEVNQWEKKPQNGSATIDLPHRWRPSVASEAGWYWREVDIPSRWKGQTVRLLFGAAAEMAEVWFDGQSVGKSEDSVTPFEFNLTQLIKPGAKQLISVRVEGGKRQDTGIWQSVRLVAHDEAYLQQVFVRANGLGNLEAEIEIQNLSKNSGGSTLEAKITSRDDPNKILKSAEQNLSVTPNLNLTTLLTSLKKKQWELWTPQAPRLYQIALSFRQELDILDTFETTFGFREFGWKSGGMSLNGLPFRPVSERIDEAIPELFSTEIDRLRTIALLQKSKERGINLLYAPGPNPILLQLGDAEGALFLEGARPGLSENATFAEMKSLILRDRSHPSVLGWDIRRLSETQATKLRALDSTRFFLTESSKSARLFAPGAEESVEVPEGFLLKK